MGKRRSTNWSCFGQIKEVKGKSLDLSYNYMTIGCDVAFIKHATFTLAEVHLGKVYTLKILTTCAYANASSEFVYVVCVNFETFSTKP